MFYSIQVVANDDDLLLSALVADNEVEHRDGHVDGGTLRHCADITRSDLRITHLEKDAAGALVHIFAVLGCGNGLHSSLSAYGCAHSHSKKLFIHGQEGKGGVRTVVKLEYVLHPRDEL